MVSEVLAPDHPLDPEVRQKMRLVGASGEEGCLSCGSQEVKEKKGHKTTPRPLPADVLPLTGLLTFLWPPKIIISFRTSLPT